MPNYKSQTTPQTVAVVRRKHEYMWIWHDGDWHFSPSSTGYALWKDMQDNLAIAVGKPKAPRVRP